MKDKYIKIAEELFTGNSKRIVLKQINNFYDAQKNYKCINKKYNAGDKVCLKKGTLLHGTYKNIDGLKEIIEHGIIASIFVNGRISKYPSCVGVWNLKKDYYLNDYINFYSGGTIRFNNMFNEDTKTMVIPYDKMSDMMDIIKKEGYQRWVCEQTKEARFLPSLVQNIVQIGIIINSDDKYLKEIKENDILNSKINDNEVKEFVDKNYYEKFIIDRKSKDDFFTDRESAIIFGIPSCFIEGIVVGKTYEKDENILNEIKKLLPNCYICNLNGIVIK